MEPNYMQYAQLINQTGDRTQGLATLGQGIDQIEERRMKQMQMQRQSQQDAQARKLSDLQIQTGQLNYDQDKAKSLASIDQYLGQGATGDMQADLARAESFKGQEAQMAAQAEAQRKQTGDQAETKRKQGLYALDALKSVAGAMKDGTIKSKEVADQIYQQALAAGGLNPADWPKEQVFQMAQEVPKHIPEGAAIPDGKGGYTIPAPRKEKPIIINNGDRANGGYPASKPMPPTALKMQQEALDAVGVASKLQADVGGFIQLIDDKKLVVGPVENIKSAARNKLGWSNENSANLTNFKTSLEEIRNNILMLAKGVQTDGDALRAYNTLIDNINDGKVVRQQLQKIKENNQRNENLQQSKVNTIRAEYGKGEGDFSGYTDQKPALGKGGKQPAKIGRYTVEEVP